MKTLRIVVYGIPAPQGSKSFRGIHGGKAILTESSKNVKPWRQAVTWAAIEQCKGGKISGPVDMCVTFTMPRPQKPKFSAPATKPDLSKLLRSTEDALTDAGVWEDDSRVVHTEMKKVYVGSLGALDAPGATITLRRSIV